MMFYCIKIQNPQLNKLHINFRAKFIEPFYVSVVVLPNDVLCRRLPGDDLSKTDLPMLLSDTSETRQKRIKVWIEKAQDYSTYVTPIGVAFLAMVAIIVVRYLFRFPKQSKKYLTLEMKS
jgi:hypothetical protein